MATRYEHADRAKQFAPFDALTGLHEAIAKREKIVIDKPDLSEDKKEELDAILINLRPGVMVTVIYYADKEFRKLTGMVSKVDLDMKVLTIVKTRINILDIIDIEIQN